MTKLFYSLVIVSLTLGGAGTFVARAQSVSISDTAQANFVTVDVAVSKGFFVRYKVPIVESSKRNNISGDFVAGGGYAFTGECDKHIGCEYFLSLTAEPAVKDRVLLAISLQYLGKWHRSEIRLSSRETRYEKLKDGVRIKAYYGLQPPPKPNP